MIMLLALITATAIIQDAPIDLVRTFKVGTKATYAFSSRIQFESRQVPLETFIPHSETYTYTINSVVEKTKPEGVADVRMKRPTISVKTGETFDRPPETHVLIKDVNQLFTLSKKNQVLDFEDFTPRPKDKDGGGDVALRVIANSGGEQLDIMGWMNQLRQLSAFVNFFDNGPVLPSDAVVVGDTWKETVGYAPITVKAGADKGKNINSRIDYEMTYRGKAVRNGKTFYHIEGQFAQDTDAAPYLAELMGMKPEASPVSSVKLKIDGKVDYYLDIATLEPAEISATSSGLIDVVVTTYSGGPFYQERFKSRASLVRK